MMPFACQTMENVPLLVVWLLPKSIQQVFGLVESVPVSLRIAAKRAVTVEEDQDVSAASKAARSFVLSCVAVLDPSVAPPAVYPVPDTSLALMALQKSLSASKE